MKSKILPILLLLFAGTVQAQLFYENVQETVDGKTRYVLQVNFEVTPCVPTEPVLHHKLTWGFNQRTATNAAVKYNFAMREMANYRQRMMSTTAQNQKDTLERVLTNPDVFAEKKAERDAFEKELDALTEDSPKSAEQLRNEKSVWYQTAEYSYYCSYPRDKFPMDKAKEFVQSIPSVYRLAEEGSRCDYCDWEQPFRGNENPIAILLPEIQEARDLARALQVKARYEVYEGDYDSAIKTIRVGKILAKHVAESPCLVSALVGIAIDGIMDAVLAELMRQPDAPNLYWTLTAPPHPAITCDKAMEVEMDILLQMLPGLSKAMDTPDEMTDADWTALQDRIYKLIPDFIGAGFGSENQQPDAFFHETALRLINVVTYPKAKQWLIDKGKTPEEVEAMSTAKVIGLWSVERSKTVRDGFIKTVSLPPWQRQSLLKEWEHNMRLTLERAVPLDMLVNLIFPAVQAAFAAETRNIVNTDALRIVEAIRCYAAENDGKLPEKLDDIVSLPIPPCDPFTGKPYDYKIKDGAGVIETNAGYSPLRFVVRVRPLQ